MPIWTIFSQYDKQYAHPMQMNVFRVMKTAYHMLYPSKEPSTIDEISSQPLKIEYTFSEQNPGPPDLSSLVIHVNRFSVLFRDMQIRDHWHNVYIPVPSELTPVIMDIYEFALARSDVCSHQWDTMTESYFARRIWRQLQVERYHQRVSQRQVSGGTNTRLPPAFWKCSICASDLIHCNSCQVASCESHDCRGSSEPPLARCIMHLNKVLCLPCLEYQDSQRLVQCPQCNSWCCTKNQLSCTGRPVGIESNSFSRRRWSNVRLIMAYCNHGRVHPPKPKPCQECTPPGWRTCANITCWSKHICPECASCGVMCSCERVWACDLCAELVHGIFVRCPRCIRPFCITCSSINQCKECRRVSLCNDCAEEAPDADDVSPADVASSCESCVGGVRMRRIYSWESQWR
ncbi:hypothetical protein BDR06DRAFT_950817 [Suillus hirtellus]|nr:hypothetical protein BDR06DRAFT_950817 [Suillus hirtellus]